jgi:hypothetical protein
MNNIRIIYWIDWIVMSLLIKIKINRILNKIIQNKRIIIKRIKNKRITNNIITNKKIINKRILDKIFKNNR